MTDKISEHTLREISGELALYIEELTITDEERKIADEDCQRSEEQSETFCDIREEVEGILHEYVQEYMESNDKDNPNPYIYKPREVNDD